MREKNAVQRKTEHGEGALDEKGKAWEMKQERGKRGDTWKKETKSKE